MLEKLQEVLPDGLYVRRKLNGCLLSEESPAAQKTGALDGYGIGLSAGWRRGQVRVVRALLLSLATHRATSSQ